VRGHDMRGDLLGAEASLSRSGHRQSAHRRALVYLKGDIDLIGCAAEVRTGTFMPPALLRRPVRGAGRAARRRARDHGADRQTPEEIAAHALTRLRRIKG